MSARATRGRATATVQRTSSTISTSSTGTLVLQAAQHRIAFCIVTAAPSGFDAVVAFAVYPVALELFRSAGVPTA